MITNEVTRLPTDDDGLESSLLSVIEVLFAPFLLPITQLIPRPSEGMASQVHRINSQAAQDWCGFASA
jgi:hypothetical protein